MRHHVTRTLALAALAMVAGAQPAGAKAPVVKTSPAPRALAASAHASGPAPGFAIGEHPSTGRNHSAPPLGKPELESAVRNYKAVTLGQRRLGDLSHRERLALIEFDRWLRSQYGIVRSETKEECEDRLGYGSSSSLEGALVDLKCSQRPLERDGDNWFPY